MNQNKMKHFIGNWRLNWRRKPFITYILLAVIIIMYLMLSFNGGSQNPFTLTYFGAKVNELIVVGEWWRLLTPMFLHIGLTHILFNGLVIYFLGAQIEAIIGHFRYLLLFIFSGLMGNAMSFAMNNAISAGASTAIFGLFASTLVLAKLYPYQVGIQQLSRNYLVLIILNILFGFFNFTIDIAGHIGGLIGGYLMMYTISAPNAVNNAKNKRLKFGILYIITLVILLTIGFIKSV